MCHNFHSMELMYIIADSVDVSIEVFCGSFISQGATVACHQLGYGAASLPTDIPLVPEFEEIEFTAACLAAERFVKPAAFQIGQSPSRSEPNIACVAGTRSSMKLKSCDIASGTRATLKGVLPMPVLCPPMLGLILCRVLNVIWDLTSQNRLDLALIEICQHQGSTGHTERGR